MIIRKLLIPGLQGWPTLPGGDLLSDLGNRVTAKTKVPGNLSLANTL
jgi:hypothetical protein